MDWRMKNIKIENMLVAMDETHVKVLAKEETTILVLEQIPKFKKKKKKKHHNIINLTYKS